MRTKRMTFQRERWNGWLTLLLGLCMLPLSICADLQDELSDMRLTLKWETRVGLTTFKTTILHSDGKVVVGSNGESAGSLADPMDGVLLLDGTTGRLLTHIKSTQPGDTDVNGVAWHKELLFFGDDTGAFFSFSERGEQRWMFQGVGDVEGAPALTDLTGDYFPDVVFATEEGFIYALDGKSGDELWQFRTSPEPTPDKYEWLQSNAFIASPAVVDINSDGVRDVLIGSRNAVFYAFDGKTGAVLWKYHTHSGIHSSALVTQSENDLRIIFAESYSEIHVLDRFGKRRGEGELSAPGGGIQGFFSSPVITPSGSILIGSAWWDDPDQLTGRGDGFWIFHPFSSGREARKFDGAGRISATPFLADILDEFYPQVGFVTENGTLLLAYHTGEAAGRFSMPAGAEATPLVADVDGDGKHEILIAMKDGFLRCYETPSEGRIEWGQFRGNNYNTGVMDDTIEVPVPVTELIRNAMQTYPKTSVLTLLYASAFALFGLLYWVWPISLLRIDRTIGKLNRLPLPDGLNVLQVPLKYFLLVRFFVYRPRVLDAWISARLPRAKEQFEGWKTVRSRRIHIVLPAILDGHSVGQLGPDSLRPAFTGQRTVIGIVGEGGSGKTSIACHIARSAMNLLQEERLNPNCPMIPVLLEPGLVEDEMTEGDELVVQVVNRLSIMFDESLEQDHELVKQLMLKKRLLILIDGVSEMTASVRTALLPGRANYPSSAVVVTSRNSEELETMQPTLVETMRIEGTRLSTFMEAYLLEAGVRQRMDDAEFFGACSRLSELVGHSEITVLLAKMYADLVINAKEQSLNLESLPQSIPDLALGYIRTLNERIQENRASYQQIKEVAQRIALECLRTDFQPRPINRNHLYDLFPGRDDVDTIVDYLETRLGIVETDGAASPLLRFSLDPLAEYLAAVSLVEKNRGDDALWQAFISEVKDTNLNAPEIHGFFRALLECCKAAPPEEVPAFVVDALEEHFTDDTP